MVRLILLTVRSQYWVTDHWYLESMCRILHVCSASCNMSIYILHTDHNMWCMSEDKSTDNYCHPRASKMANSQCFPWGKQAGRVQWRQHRRSQFIAFAECQLWVVLRWSSAAIVKSGFTFTVYHQALLHLIPQMNRGTVLTVIRTAFYIYIYIWPSYYCNLSYIIRICMSLG